MAQDIELSYDDGAPSPRRDDEGPNWLTYDDHRPQGLITGSSYWSKVSFTPASRFQLQLIYFEPLNQYINVEDALTLRVYSEDEDHNLDELLYELIIEEVPELDFENWVTVELDEDDFLTFEGGQNFCIMYDAPGGAYGNNQAGDGWWNIYDGSNDFDRSFYQAADFGDDPDEDHGEWQNCTGDLLIRANGTYLEDFVDLQLSAFYNESLKWTLLPGSEQTFMADISNNGNDIEEFILNFSVENSDGDIVWNNAVVIDGLEVDGEITVSAEEVWAVPEGAGNYSAWCEIEIEDNEAENNLLGLDQIVINPDEDPDFWIGYVDDEMESTTAWNEDSGWAGIFWHPGDNDQALTMDAFRVLIATIPQDVGEVSCDFQVMILDLEANPPLNLVWEGQASTTGEGEDIGNGTVLEWVTVEPEFDENVGIFPGQAFLVTYFYNSDTRFPVDDSPPLAGANDAMPFAFLTTGNDGGSFGLANAGDYPIQCQLSWGVIVPEGPHLRFDPEMLDFGYDLELNQDYTIDMYFISFGDAPVEVSTIRIAPSAADYITFDPDRDIEIPAQDTVAIRFTFRTNEEIQLENRILVMSNDMDNHNFLLNIHASTYPAEPPPRMVLVENFTSTTCQVCAGFTPHLAEIIEENQEYVIPVMYHMNWPAEGNDPWFANNRDHNLSRRYYYDVNAIPSLFIDGNASGRNDEDIADNIQAALNVEPVVSVDVSGNTEDNILSIVCDIGSVIEGDLPNLTAYIALTENFYEYDGPNGDNEHRYPMVRMFPNGNGSAFDLDAGTNQVFEFEIDLQDLSWHDLDVDNLTLAAWVQDEEMTVLNAGKAGLNFDNGGQHELQHFTDFIATEVNHNIFIEPLTFGGNMAPQGWEIGAFTPEGILAGGAVWTVDARCRFVAFGDDEETEDVVEGFVADEPFSFRIWDNEADVEYAATVTHAEGSENWEPNGSSRFILAAVRELVIPLLEGWNMISLNVVPGEEFWIDDIGPDVERMFEQLRIDEDNHRLVLLKDGFGMFYSPVWGFNNLPCWTLTEGYQVKVTEDVDLLFTGDPIPYSTDIPMVETWNIVAYFPTFELDASAPDFYVLSSIIDNVSHAKDSWGRFMLPAFGFSNMTPWRETEGYMIKINEAGVLNYPPLPNEEGVRLAGLNARPSEITTGEDDCHWSALRNSNSNMSVLLNKVNTPSLPANSQVAAFSAEGILVGSGCVDPDGRCGLSVWGDDPYTTEIEGLQEGEAFELRLWNADRLREETLTVTGIFEGEGLRYKADAFTVMDASTVETVPDEFYLSDGFPNPFNSVTTLHYGLPEGAEVSIAVFDPNGRQITSILDRGSQSAGDHTVLWNATGISSGVYMVQMKVGNVSQTRKVVLLR